jgi:hypothetical protein
MMGALVAITIFFAKAVYPSEVLISFGGSIS